MVKKKSDDSFHYSAKRHIKDVTAITKTKLVVDWWGNTTMLSVWGLVMTMKWVSADVKIGGNNAVTQVVPHSLPPP